MKKTKLINLLALFTIATLLLAACGQATTDPDETDTMSEENPSQQLPTLTPAADEGGESEGSQRLSGTSWRVENVTVANESFIPAQEMTVTFNPDGTLSGSNGCNIYGGGSYSEDGNQITIDMSVVEMTERACEQMIMTQGEQFIATMSGTHTVSLIEQTLTLTREDGSSVRLSAQMGDGGAAGGTMLAPQPLDGTRWLLIGYGADAATPVSGEVTLNFEQSMMSGSGGCNQFSAPYAVEEDRIVLTEQLNSTLMACADDALNQQEQAILAALNSMQSFSRESNTLRINYEGGVLEYMAVTSTAAELENQTWNVNSLIVGGDAAISMVQGSSITMTFQDGRVTGNTGCNEYFADYTVDGESIKLGPVGSTRRACPEGLGDQEQTFLELLSMVNRFTVEGPQLTLYADTLQLMVLTQPEAMP